MSRTQILDDSKSPESASSYSPMEAIEGREPRRVLALRLFTAVSTKSSGHNVEEDTFLTIFMELAFQLVSPIGLLGNLASIMSIADRWRATATADHLLKATTPDVWWVYFLNGIGLSLGCFANLVLFLHVELWVARHVCVVVTSCCYMSAVAIYMILLAITEYRYFSLAAGNVHRTIGYWQSACASALYFVAATITVAYAFYFRPRQWNITVSKRQRLVMILSLIYFAWIAGGGAIFQLHSMLDQPYAEAVYFVVVSCLTLGYGDVIPKTNVSKALDIPLIYAGLLIGGWVAFAVFQGNLDKAHNSAVYVAVQKRRRELLESRPDISEPESFLAMRRIVKKEQLRDQLIHASITSVWLMVFWLCGALVFSYTESWGYFDAFYMCAISLAGVGYGDYVPTSPGGRAMFIHWALVALPTMAAAVSDLGSFIVMIVGKHGEIWVWLTHRMMKHSERKTANDDDPSDNMEKLKRDGIHGLHLKLMSKRDISEEAQHSPHKYLDEIQQQLPNDSMWHAVVNIAKRSDKCQFDHNAWNRAVSALLKTELPPGFWLSEDSPLRHVSLDEKNFLTMTALHLLEVQEELEQS